MTVLRNKLPPDADLQDPKLLAKQREYSPVAYSGKQDEAFRNLKEAHSEYTKVSASLDFFDAIGKPPVKLEKLLSPAGQFCILCRKTYKRGQNDVFAKHCLTQHNATFRGEKGEPWMDR